MLESREMYQRERNKVNKSGIYIFIDGQGLNSPCARQQQKEGGRHKKKFNFVK